MRFDPSIKTHERDRFQEIEHAVLPKSGFPLFGSLR
jgi:hypothetical protein